MATGIDPAPAKRHIRPAPHWREYGIEAAALGAFMVSAVFFTVLLEHPASPVRQAVTDAFLRRALTGLAMGLTAITLIYSPPGRRSGLHMNPAVTLTFYRLGKVRVVDAAGYVVAQVVGATVVMVGFGWVARSWVADVSVNFVQTLPGPAGVGVAFAAETGISLGMMFTVLTVSSTRWAGWTGVCAGCLVALYITFEAPLSGMSMNPARTFGPAFVAGMLGPLWIYVAAPLAGMLAASELHLRLRGRHTVRCAKLHHDARYPCIFHCTHPAGAARQTTSIPAPAAMPTEAALPRPRGQAGHEVCS